MASQIPAPWDRSADGRSAVASELDAIFAPLPSPPLPAEAAASARPSVRRRRGPGLAFIVLGVAVLAALAAGLALLLPALRHGTPPPSTRIAVSPVPAPRPAPIVVPPPATTPTPAAIVPREAPPQPAPTVAPKPVATTLPRRVAAPARHVGCPRSATEAWCLHGAITGADRDLRDAYAAAARAGVARATLVGIRSDWKRLRGRANRDPRALIRGYALLTQALRAETSRVRR